MLMAGTSRALAVGAGCAVAMLGGAAKGAGFKLLYSFQGGSDGANPYSDLIDVRGTLFGTTYAGGGAGCAPSGCGTVFSVTKQGEESVLYRFKGSSDGARPQAGLIDVDGVFYGTTDFGGGCPSGGNCGTIFSLTPSGGETVLHAFQGGADGDDPQSALLDVGGTFYGTTEFGGGTKCFRNNGCGTSFSITPGGARRFCIASATRSVLIPWQG